MFSKRNLGVLSVLFLIAAVGYQGHYSGTRASAQSTQASVPAYPVQDFSNDTAYPVVAVVDGDTIKIQYQGKQVSVRLIGVDTPETVHSSGKEVSTFTKNLLLEEHVYLRPDIGANEKDRYGRLLSYVYRAPDGLFVNLEIVRQGYGHVYTQFPFKWMELFQHYATHAQKVGKGLHAPDYQPDRKPEIAPESTPDVTVYVTQTGKKYHLGSCRSLRRSKIPMSLKGVKQRYGPCARCNPPR